LKSLELLKGQSWHSEEFQNVILGIKKISSIIFFIDTTNI
jgi:hypothetical protein